MFAKAIVVFAAKKFTVALAEYILEKVDINIILIVLPIVLIFLYSSSVMSLGAQIAIHLIFSTFQRRRWKRFLTKMEKKIKDANNAREKKKWMVALRLATILLKIFNQIKEKCMFVYVLVKYMM